MTQAAMPLRRNCPSVVLEEPAQLGHFVYYRSLHFKIAAVGCRRYVVCVVVAPPPCPEGSRFGVAEALAAAHLSSGTVYGLKWPGSSGDCRMPEAALLTASCCPELFGIWLLPGQTQFTDIIFLASKITMIISTPEMWKKRHLTLNSGSQ